MERTKNIFDKIGSLIPGYPGYADREVRRQCDKILREKTDALMNSCENVVKKRIETVVKNNNLDQLDDMETCRKKINNLSSKIKFAPYGVSGFFSNSQIREDELLEIYRKDLKIMEDATKLKESIENLTIDDILSAIDNVESLIVNRNLHIEEYK
jgi:hypothetical protein